MLLFHRYVAASALSRPLWRLPPLLKCVQRAGRINAWRSSDELDHLLKLGSAELSRDLLNAALMEQQDSRDNGLGHALGGSPTHIVRMKTDVKTIRHSAGIYSVSGINASLRGVNLDRLIERNPPAPDVFAAARRHRRH